MQALGGGFCRKSVPCFCFYVSWGGKGQEYIQGALVTKGVTQNRTDFQNRKSCYVIRGCRYQTYLLWGAHWGGKVHLMKSRGGLKAFQKGFSKGNNTLPATTKMRTHICTCPKCLKNVKKGPFLITSWLLLPLGRTLLFPPDPCTSDIKELALRQESKLSWNGRSKKAGKFLHKSVYQCHCDQIAFPLKKSFNFCPFVAWGRDQLLLSFMSWAEWFVQKNFASDVELNVSHLLMTQLWS